MITRRFAVPALGALLLLAGASARAWGPVGHKAVGMIAQSRLSPGTLAAVEALLGPGGSLQKIANCADQFVYTQERSCAGLFPMTGDPAPTKPWHYFAVSVDSVADETSQAFCPRGACVVAQIRKDVAVLKDPAASAADKRMALMFLVHFVGDVHQPLHNITDVPTDYGGNLKVLSAIAYAGKPLTLHQLWDNVVEDPAKGYWLPDDAQTAQAEALALPLEAVPPGDAAAWTAGDLVGAASAESYLIAKTVIYPDYKASRGGDLLADYQAKMRPIAYRRVQTAGVRLAALLEQAFGAPSPASAAAQRSLSTLESGRDALDKR